MLRLAKFSFHPFPIDHILTVSLAGTNDLNNLAYACQHCNNCKYNKVEYIDPLTGKKVPLFHPRQQKWSEHFIWSPEDFPWCIRPCDSYWQFHKNGSGFKETRK